MSRKQFGQQSPVNVEEEYEDSSNDNQNFLSELYGSSNYQSMIINQVNGNTYGQTTQGLYIQSDVNCGQQGPQTINGNNNNLNQPILLEPQVHNVRRGFAGETKNIAKNLSGKFQKFIKENLDKQYYTNTIKKFLKQRNLGKKKFENYLKDKLLKQLASEFFGRLEWVRYFNQDNKTDIRQYFRQAELFQQ